MVKGSLSIIKANAAPKNDEVEYITPVFMEPISLRAKTNSTIEKPMLKAPTEIRYGIENIGILKSTPNKNDRSKRSEPPPRHFKATRCGRSRFLLSSLLKLLSTPQNRQAKTINKLPTMACIN